MRLSKGRKENGSAPASRPEVARPPKATLLQTESGASQQPTGRRVVTPATLVLECGRCRFGGKATLLNRVEPWRWGAC